MTATEFKTLVTMISRLDERLNERIDSLRTEMTAGFSKQEALSQEILRITGEYISDLELRFENTRKQHAKRLDLLEKRAS